MKVYAPAKVNLGLDVVRTMENGYHELDMIMAPISLYDELDIEYADQDKIEIEKTKQGTNMKVHAAFTEPDEDKAVSQVTTYPYVVAETELTSLPSSIELIAKYVH